MIISEYVEIELPQVVAFFDSAALHAELSKAMGKSKNLLINADQVTRITTPALQVLISAKNTVEGVGGNFKLKNKSLLLSETLNLLGLTEI